MEHAVGAQPPRQLKAKFHLDFRTTDYSPDTLLQGGLEEVLRDEKGLLIRLPAGDGKRQDTDLFTIFSMRGDFEVTVSFEILKADQPNAGDGVGAIMDAWIDPHGNNTVSLAHRLLPNGKTVFVVDRAQRVQGKWTHQLKSLPATEIAGKLRMEREGALLRCRVSEGKNAEFVTVAAMDIGRADLNGIKVGGSTGGSENGLDLRLVDLTVRAEVLPGLSDVGLGGETGLKRLDATQLANLEEKLQKFYAQLAPSVVRIVGPKSEGGFSGVIVSPSGEILTCAHHGLAPKTKVTVELADGRKVKATILGSVKRPNSGACAMTLRATLPQTLAWSFWTKRVSGLRQHSARPPRKKAISAWPSASPMSTSPVSRRCYDWVGYFRHIRSARSEAPVGYCQVTPGDRCSISKGMCWVFTKRWNR